MGPPDKTPQDEESEEEDYMTMAFPSAPAKPETTLQRRQRLEREGRERGHHKSKADIAAETDARREAGLARPLIPPPSSAPAAAPASKGLAMMARMGFAGGALGAADNADARAEPLRIEVRAGRAGIGAEDEGRKRAAAAVAEAEERVKRARQDEGGYRDRVRAEREAARTERLVGAAQGVAEAMAEERAGVGAGAVPLKSVNVLWRGVVRAREEAERDRRMRRDLEDSLSRLPTYEDEDEDEDVRVAAGKGGQVYAAAEDLDEEDAELDEFNALEPGERLRRLVLFLRSEFRYCFWCKFTYPDDAMEGCPGLTEEDHD